MGRALQASKQLPYILQIKSKRFSQNLQSDHTGPDEVNRQKSVSIKNGINQVIFTD